MMTKPLPKFLLNELKNHGWKDTAEQTPMPTYITNGIELQIVPARLNKMYYLTRTKMSDTTTRFINEDELLELIETEGDRK
jgi:hypothetical protein